MQHCFHLHCQAVGFMDCLILTKEALQSSETSVTIQQSKRRSISEASSILQRPCETLKFCEYGNRNSSFFSLEALLYTTFCTPKDFHVFRSLDYISESNTKHLQSVVLCYHYKVLLHVSALCEQTSGRKQMQEMCAYPVSYT